MGNSRSIRRRISGKSGSSPGKSKRAQSKRQRAVWQAQAARMRFEAAATASLTNLEALSSMAKEKMDASDQAEDDDG